MITKICGIKERETLTCCEKNNIDFFGMIFYLKSPRNISIHKAKKLQIFSKNLKIKGVGVFFNEDINKVIDIIKNLDLKYVQLHGDEDNKYVNSLKKLNVNIIKKISVSKKTDLNKVNKYNDVDYFLFDYKPNKNELPGGNAKKFDWRIIKNYQIEKPWFLSGGVNSDNIQLIMKEFNPFGVDLSSGVEKDLGIKDNDIINNFMDKLSNA